MAYSRGGWRWRRARRLAGPRAPAGGASGAPTVGGATRPLAVAGAATLALPAPWWRRRPGSDPLSTHAESTSAPGDQRGILGRAPPRTASVELANLDPGLRARADANARRPAAPATVRAYASDWARFVRWCAAAGARPLPALVETIRTHLSALAEGIEGKPGLRYATIERAYAAIRVQHANAGHRLDTLPEVTFTLSNIARTIHRVQTEKRALELDDLKAAVDGLPPGLVGLRDRAVLLLGWSIAQRRADIAALDVSDLEWTPEGMLVTVRRSKTDQEGRGHRIPVERVGGRWCPVAALEAWLAEIPSEGPIVRKVVRHGKEIGERMSGDDVSRIVKAAVASIGKDPDLYGGHSLRRGFVTSAKKNGRDLDAIMRTTGHKSVQQVRRYIEVADPFESPTAASMLVERGAVEVIFENADPSTVRSDAVRDQRTDPSVADPVEALWRSTRGSKPTPAKPPPSETPTEE